MRRALLLAAVLSGFVFAPAAQAGTPFTVGEGRDPHLLVDSAGTAHVVWKDETGKIFYCQVPRGGTSCAIGRVIEDGIDDSPYILSPGGGTLYIVVPYYVGDKTYLWTSTDNGATWGPRTLIYDHGGGTDSTEPVLGPEGGQITFAAWNPSATVWGAAIDGSESASEVSASLSGAGNYDTQVAPTEDGGLVAVANDLDNASFFRMGPGGNPSDQTAWGGASPIGPGEDTRLAGGPGGTYMLATVGPTNAHMDIRKWTGAGFAPPVSIPEYGYINDIFVSPSGGVAAIWRVNGSPNRLRMALSTDGGAGFAMRTIALGEGVMADMDVAVAGDNQGFATFESGPGSSGARATIGVASTDPVDDGTTLPPGAGGGGEGMVPDDAPSIRRRTANVGGARLLFDVPGNCIPLATSRFSVRLSVRRFPRRGTFVNVKRVFFYVGRRRVKRDRKAPFVKMIRIRNPVAGRTYTLRTRAFIKRKGKRKLQRKRVSAPVTICPS